MLTEFKGQYEYSILLHNAAPREALSGQYREYSILLTNAASREALSGFSERESSSTRDNCTDYYYYNISKQTINKVEQNI